MALASLDDVNVHLPQDKLAAEESDLEFFQVDAQRIIKGYLAGVDPFTPQVLAGWDGPDNTPETIRAIAGRLIAAAYYANRFSEEDPDVPAYSQKLYNEGMAMLVGVMNGTIEIEEVSTNVEGTLSSDDFWPNDTTEGPLFKISDTFA